MGITASHLSVNSNFLGGRFSVQAASLKQDWRCAMAHDRVHLPAIKSYDVPSLPLDIRAGDEGNAIPQRLSGPSQDVLPFRVIQKIHITGIHVYRVHQSGSMSVGQMSLKRFDGDLAIQVEWQEGSRYALHLAAKNPTIRKRFNFHLSTCLVAENKMRVLSNSRFVPRRHGTGLSSLLLPHSTLSHEMNFCNSCPAGSSRKAILFAAL